MDHVSPEQTSENMRRIRAVDTVPELTVRRHLHNAGLRFRVHRRDLPGNPDIVLPGRRVCVFVHGCFWHGCPHFPNRTIALEDMRGFPTIADAIGDLRRSLKRELYNHYAPKLSALNLRRIAHLSPGDDWRDLPRHPLPAGMQRALQKDHTRRFRRMTWDGVARSIITRFRDPKSGEYIHPDQPRTISIREAARIRSFPMPLSFIGGYCDQYKQVGEKLFAYDTDVIPIRTKPSFAA